MSAEPRQSLLISGLPGKMAAEVVDVAQAAPDMQVLPKALSSAAHDGQSFGFGTTTLKLVGDAHRAALEIRPDAIAIDFSTPASALDNAEWYVSQSIPFVMGTTGFDLAEMKSLIAGASVSAVVAPNMATPIVMIQAAMRWLAAEFPGGCQDTTLTIRESHQQGKRDTSGTAKALVSSFQQLGINFEVDQITKLREPPQQSELGVPNEHLGAHAFHRYELQSAADTVNVVLEHNVVGRRVYAEGTLQAVRFLQRQVAAGVKGVMSTMEDVLRG